MSHSSILSRATDSVVTRIPERFRVASQAAVTQTHGVRSPDSRRWWVWTSPPRRGCGPASSIRSRPAGRSEVGASRHSCPSSSCALASRRLPARTLLRPAVACHVAASVLLRCRRARYEIARASSGDDRQPTLKASSNDFGCNSVHCRGETTVPTVAWCAAVECPASDAGSFQDMVVSTLAHRVLSTARGCPDWHTPGSRCAAGRVRCRTHTRACIPRMRAGSRSGKSQTRLVMVRSVPPGNRRPVAESRAGRTRSDVPSLGPASPLTQRANRTGSFGGQPAMKVPSSAGQPPACNERIG